MSSLRKAAGPTGASGPIYYEAQEAAMAPGIVKDWPAYIKHPTDKNGRLRQITEADLRKRFAQPDEQERLREALREAGEVCMCRDGAEWHLLSCPHTIESGEDCPPYCAEARALVSEPSENQEESR